MYHVFSVETARIFYFENISNLQVQCISTILLIEGIRFLFWGNFEWKIKITFDRKQHWLKNNHGQFGECNISLITYIRVYHLIEYVDDSIPIVCGVSIESSVQLKPPNSHTYSILNEFFFLLVNESFGVKFLPMNALFRWFSINLSIFFPKIIYNFGNLNFNFIVFVNICRNTKKLLPMCSWLPLMTHPRSYIQINETANATAHVYTNVNANTLLFHFFLEQSQRVCDIQFGGQRMKTFVTSEKAKIDKTNWNWYLKKKGRTGEECTENNEKKKHQKFERKSIAQYITRLVDRLCVVHANS